MNKIRSFFFTDFTIFSLLILLQAFFHQIGIVDDFTSLLVLQYFALSVLITFTEWLIHKVFKNVSLLCRMTATIICAFLEAFILGGLILHWYTISAKWIILTFAISAIITPVLYVLYVITGIISTKNTAKEINRSIKRKRTLRTGSQSNAAKEEDSSCAGK